MGIFAMEIEGYVEFTWKHFNTNGVVFLGTDEYMGTSSLDIKVINRVQESDLSEFSN